MLNTIADVLNFRADTGDGRLPVDEVFIDARDGRVRYVAVDIGGWFDSTQAIVKARRFGRPDTGTQLWPVELGRYEIEAQPQWKDRGWFDWLSNLQVSPHFFVGPFGMGYDPMVLAQIDKHGDLHDRNEALKEASEKEAQAKFEAERKKIEESWAEAENISVDFLEHATRVVA